MLGEAEKERKQTATIPLNCPAFATTQISNNLPYRRAGERLDAQSGIPARLASAGLSSVASLSERHVSRVLYHLCRICSFVFVQVSLATKTSARHACDERKCIWKKPIGLVTRMQKESPSHCAPPAPPPHTSPPSRISRANERSLF